MVVSLGLLERVGLPEPQGLLERVGPVGSYHLPSSLALTACIPLGL